MKPSNLLHRIIGREGVGQFAPSSLGNSSVSSLDTKGVIEPRCMLCHNTMKLCVATDGTNTWHEFYCSACDQAIAA